MTITDAVSLPDLLFHDQRVLPSRGLETLAAWQRGADGD